ncbi:glycosyltransferase family 4 protein [Paenisporosarcina sp. FSL H8-0542]|uniref:glycosyltransferase family 4 protein n=1 Tax=Paenisporosarcina sp. FSL H8-0542 TaxID=2921401 RepID=UPI00315A6060
MKILLVANMYPSSNFPSYGVFVQNTEKILQNEGFQVDKAVLQKKTSKLSKILGYAIYYSKILSKGLTGNYDAIYVHYASHNAMPLLWLKKLKPSVRIVTNVHGSDVVPEVASQEKYQPAVKKLLQQSSLIITPSHYYEKLVQQKYGVKTPIRVFPSGGVNAEVFHPKKNQRIDILSQLKLDPAFRYIGYVGRLDVGKGWDHYLRAISFYMNEKPEERDRTRFIAVGSGKEDDAFKELAKSLGIEDVIIHYPLMKQSDLANIYTVIEAFIFPTTRKGESLGLVGLEAMACKTPILASAIGGILDYVQDGQNGWLFTPGDAVQLKDLLVKFDELSNEEYEKISQAAYETALQYEQTTIQSKLSAIFNELNPQTTNERGF